MVQDLPVHQRPTVPGCRTQCSQYFSVTATSSAAQFILHPAHLDKKIMYAISNETSGSKMQTAYLLVQVGLRGKISDLCSSDACIKPRAGRWIFGFCGIPHARQANTGSVSCMKPQRLSYIPSISVITDYHVIHRCIIWSVAFSFYNAALSPI